VVVPGAGDQVDRAVDGPADVLAGGHDAVPGTSRHPAGADPGEEVEVGFVFGEDDRPGGQGGDLVADAGADLVVVGDAFGDESGPGPAGLFTGAAVDGAQAHVRPAEGPPDAGGGPGFRGVEQPMDTVAQTAAAQPGPAGAGPVREPVESFQVVPDDPPPYRTRVEVQYVGDLGGGHATGGQQDHHRPGGDPPLLVQGGDEFGVLLVGQVGVDVGRAHTGRGLVVVGLVCGNQIQTRRGLSMPSSINSGELRT
jgi:hypothetical protein